MNKDLKIYKIFYKELSLVVSSIDPVALGGVDEYNREIDSIIKLIMSKRRFLTKDEILAIFLKNYDLCLSLNKKEIDFIYLKIKDMVKAIY